MRARGRVGLGIGRLTAAVFAVLALCLVPGQGATAVGVVPATPTPGLAVPVVTPASSIPGYAVTIDGDGCIIGGVPGHLAEAFQPVGHSLWGATVDASGHFTLHVTLPLGIPAGTITYQPICLDDNLAVATMLVYPAIDIQVGDVAPPTSTLGVNAAGTELSGTVTGCLWGSGPGVVEVRIDHPSTAAWTTGWSPLADTDAAGNATSTLAVEPPLAPGPHHIEQRCASPSGDQPNFDFPALDVVVDQQAPVTTIGSTEPGSTTTAPTGPAPSGGSSAIPATPTYTG